jgi:hypothetical protein
MYGTNGRKGVSKLAVPVAVIVVLAVAGGYFVLTRTSTPPTSSSAGSLPNAPVSTAVNELIQDINARNVDGLVTLYSANAVDTWTGSTGGLVGKYTPVENIRLLYATTVGKSTTMDANFSDYSEDTLSPTIANATFVMGMLANSTVAGIVTAKIDVSEQWNWGSAGWQITKENWAYTYYDSSFIDAGIPSSTTFPQWGYMLKGGNPNLVSEKSFEWHAGPYLAAGLYAFLFGIVVVLALRSRTRGRGDSAGQSRRAASEK